MLLCQKYDGGTISVPAVKLFDMGYVFALSSHVQIVFAFILSVDDNYFSPYIFFEKKLSFAHI